MTDAPDEKEVAEIRERRGRITPGEWQSADGISESDTMRCGVTVVQGNTGYLLATIENGAPGDFCETEKANADFIAHAPTDIDKLLSSHTSLKARVETLERERDEALMLAEGPSTLHELAAGSIERGFRVHELEARLSTIEADEALRMIAQNKRLRGDTPQGEKT